eukprot:6086792-Alexandrium_andersonii.AAC.1
MRAGGLQLSRIPSRGEGPLARWECLDCGPLGLDIGPRAHFDQRVKWLHRCADIWVLDDTYTE